MRVNLLSDGDGLKKEKGVLHNRIADLMVKAHHFTEVHTNVQTTVVQLNIFLLF